MTTIIVKVTPEAKQYYLQHKDDPSCDFSRFCRSVKSDFIVKTETIYETHKTYFVKYYLKNPETRFEAFKRLFICRRKKENFSEELTTGRVLIALYQSEEPFQMKNKFVRCVEKVIQLKIGKGIEKIRKQGFKGCFIKDKYLPEKLDPQHYSKVLSQKLFEIWKNNSTTLEYQTWRKSDTCYRAIEWFQRNPENVDPEFRTIRTDKMTGKLSSRIDLTKIKVEYLDAKKREKYLVQFKTPSLGRTKLLDQADNPLTGTLIYVIDAERNMFAAPKQKGSFHHSSFLSGEPVICAGRIALNNKGEILWISNESGHYTPTQDQFEDGLKVFTALGVDIYNGRVVNIQTNSSPPAENPYLHWIRNKQSPAFENLEGPT